MLDTLGGPRLGVILKLVLGGLHVKHEVNHGILVPTQNLLWDRGRLRKIFKVADHMTFRMYTGFQSTVFK
jgi:hypothetical protein